MRHTVDRSLLDRFVRGDEDAFEVLFRHFATDVYRWAVRIVRNERAAEEVVVEAFWRAYRGRARFDPSRAFGPWIRRVATNAALDHLRAARRSSAPSLDDAPVPATAAHDASLRDSIATAFRRLPAKLQVAAVLALVEELPYAEIADALDVPLGTVKSRVFRAVRALRKELDRLGIRP
jgi:RNA polymerase sigma-70 factor (ECF subfamily)